MNLDALIRQIREISSDKVVQQLGDLLLDWKADDRTAEELRESVERYFGTAWIERDADHSRAYGLWSPFRDDAIAGIGGMTMNERLYFFSLMERFDDSTDDVKKRTVYTKLLANP